MSLPLSSRIFRLSRVQFLPVILSPILVGTSLAWWTSKSFNPLVFSLALMGGVALHLGSNTVDDAYDYQTGVDVISNDMFPPDFGGWKPLPRGLMTFPQAKLISYVFFAIATLAGLSLALLTGPFVIILGLVGLFFAYFHVAPPLRLAYRGLGLSELGIFLSFGVLPVIGCFYVQTGVVSTASIFLGIPLGLLTTGVLVNHDQIFFDAYNKGGKRSYTVAVGRKAAMVTAFIFTLMSYGVVVLAVLMRALPASGLLVLLTVPLYLIQIRLYTTEARSPLHYVKLTQATFTLSVLFGAFLAVGMLLG